MEKQRPVVIIPNVLIVPNAQVDQVNVLVTSSIKVRLNGAKMAK